MREERKFIFSTVKILSFLILWAIFTFFLLVTPPFKPYEIVVPLESNKVFTTLLNDQNPHGSSIRVEIYGNIDEAKTNHPTLASESDPHVEVAVEFFDTNLEKNIWKSKVWLVYIDQSPSRVTKYIDVDQSKRLSADDVFGTQFNPLIEFRVTFLNLQNVSDGFSIKITPTPLNRNTGNYLKLIIILCFPAITEWPGRTLWLFYQSNLLIRMFSNLGVFNTRHICLYILNIYFYLTLFIRRLDWLFSDYFIVYTDRIRSGKPYIFRSIDINLSFRISRCNERSSFIV